MYCRVYCRVPSLESLTLGTVCPSGNLALGTMVTCTAAATLEGSNCGAACSNCTRGHMPSESLVWANACPLRFGDLHLTPVPII